MKKITFPIKKISLLFVVLALSGCANESVNNAEETIAFLKRKHISLVVKGFNKKPDIIEDWSNYKRYTWQVCRSTNSRARPQSGAAYGVACCNATFEADVNDFITGANLATCPVSIDFKQVNN